MNRYDCYTKLGAPAGLSDFVLMANTPYPDLWANEGTR